MKHLNRWFATGLIAAVMAGCQAEAVPETSVEADPVAVVTPVAIPDWARANIAYMTEGTGRWVADNAAYKSENEVWDAYVMEWTAGPDDLSMTARMYGMAGGQPSSADFWSFYQYWDYAVDEMRVLQSGWGVVGDGTLDTDDAAGGLVSLQSFTTSAGDVNRVRHLFIELDAARHETTSFNPGEDGSWVRDRSYVWVRQDTGA